jgi:hypothetical protein
MPEFHTVQEVRTFIPPRTDLDYSVARTIRVAEDTNCNSA